MTEMGKLYIVNFGGELDKATGDFAEAQAEPAGNTLTSRLVTVVSNDLQTPTGDFPDASVKADVELLKAWVEGRRI